MNRLYNFFSGLPEISPINVCIEVFTPDYAPGQPLDSRAMLSRDLSPFQLPLPDGRLCYGQGPRKGRLGANNGCCSIDRMHAHV